MDYGAARPHRASVEVEVVGLGAAGGVSNPALSIPDTIEGLPEEVQKCHGKVETEQWEGLQRYKARSIKFGNATFSQPCAQTYNAILQLRGDVAPNADIAQMTTELNGGMSVIKKLLWTINQNYDTYVYSPQLDALIKKLCFLNLANCSAAHLLRLTNDVAVYLKQLGRKEHDKLFNAEKRRMIAHANGGLSRAFLKEPYHASAFYLILALMNFDQCKGSCTLRDFLSHVIDKGGQELSEHLPISFEHIYGGMLYSPYVYTHVEFEKIFRNKAHVKRHFTNKQKMSGSFLTILELSAKTAFCVDVFWALHSQTLKLRINQLQEKVHASGTPNPMNKFVQDCKDEFCIPGSYFKSAVQYGLDWMGYIYGHIRASEAQDDGSYKQVQIGKDSKECAPYRYVDASQHIASSDTIEPELRAQMAQFARNTIAGFHLLAEETDNEDLRQLASRMKQENAFASTNSSSSDEDGSQNKHAARKASTKAELTKPGRRTKRTKGDSMTNAFDVASSEDSGNGDDDPEYKPNGKDDPPDHLLVAALKKTEASLLSTKQHAQELPNNAEDSDTKLPATTATGKKRKTNH